MIDRNRAVVRLGVLGLGKRWSQEIRPAVAGRPERFQVVAIYDPVAQRAETEAARWRAAAVGGIRALIAHPLVDAIVFDNECWFGMFPLGLVSGSGKKCLILNADMKALEAVERVGSRSGDAARQDFLMFLWRFAPVTLRLRELFATHLGPPIRLEGVSSEGSGLRWTGGEHDASSALEAAILETLDWCGFLFPTWPNSVRRESGTVEGSRTETLELSYAGGACARFEVGGLGPSTQASGVASPFPERFRLETERGWISVENGVELSWGGSARVEKERLGGHEAMLDTMLEHFSRAVEGQPSLFSSQEDLMEILRLARTPS